MRRNRVPTQWVMAGFTLIELLVVIVVIAILGAILFPVFAQAREKARQATCLSNQHQIARGVLMYIGDYDEIFPFVLDFSGNFTCLANQGDNGKWPFLRGVTGLEPQFQLVTVVAPYVKNGNVWYCPSVGPDSVNEGWDAAGCWMRVRGKAATMRDQGTTYAYTYNAPSARKAGVSTFMGGKPLSILLDSSRWPMLCDEPDGKGFTGNIADPPSSAAPHSGGVDLAYGDGHVKYHHLEEAEGGVYLGYHAGDGLYPDQ